MLLLMQSPNHFKKLMKTVLNDLLNSMNVQLYGLSGHHLCVCRAFKCLKSYELYLFHEYQASETIPKS